MLGREIWRKDLDKRIRGLSKGPATTSDRLETKKWYCVDTTDGFRVVVFQGAVDSRMKVVDVETYSEQVLEGVRS